MTRKPLALPEPMDRIPRPNLTRIAARLPLAANAPVELPAEFRFVFLCFLNRSGSAHLGDILSSTGYFEPARESLNADEVLPLCREHGIGSFAEYFAHIVRRDARNNTYIVKLAPEQIILLIESGVLDQIIDRSDFLFLSRADRLAQAISGAIAQQNSRWAWNSPIGLPDDKLVYSPGPIAHNLNHLTILHLCFERFFAFNGIAPIAVGYERLVSRPQDEVDEIARRLGLPPLKADLGKLHYRRQANEINQAWRARFLLEPAMPPDDSLWAWAPPRATAAASPQAASPTIGAVEADIVAHIRNVGDVRGECGAWIGRPRSGLWIEGFSITPRQGLASQDIEYQGYQHFGQELPWVSGGRFGGTRGLTVPLRGLRVRLRSEAAVKYQCVYSAMFQDGTTVGPVPAGQLCQSASLAPLEAFRIEIRARSP
jgi:LPS sulfotransferase NodH